MNLLNISGSPHVHSDESTKKIMWRVNMALVPALLCAIAYFGLPALLVSLVSVAACVLFQWLIEKFILKVPSTVGDGSAVVTGLLLAFNVPATAQMLWIVVIGALVAIGIGKMSFGGLGKNPFNPALVGRVFLGHIGGSMGEVSAIAILLGACYLLWKKVITWHIPVAFIGTAFVFSGILWLIDPESFMDPLMTILTGGIMLGACFMATDMVTSPMAKSGQLIFGVGCGLLTIIIRNWGSYPEGVSFAILIMNSVTPLLNRWCKPKRFAC